MAENLIMSTHRVVCPFYKRHEYEELCNYRECRCIDPKKNNNNYRRNTDRIHTDSTCITYNEIDHKFCGDEATNKCINLKFTSNASEMFLHKFQNRIHSPQSVVTKSIDNSLLQKHKQNQQHQKNEIPATQSTKDIKNTFETAKISCLLCKKLQRPQITKFSSIILPTLIKLFPLLIPFSVKSIGKKQKQIEARRQDVKSKTIMRLVIILTRLLCILHIAVVPSSIAIASTVPQEQAHTSPHQSLAFNATATMMQATTNRHDIRVKNLVTKRSQFNIIASSPAPALSAFLAPGHEAPPLTPIDSRIISFVNRDNILKQFQQKISPSTDTINPSKPASSLYSSCSTCQLRKAKNDSLESIKLHILSKLRLKEAPKIEVPRDVPQNIIKDFNRRFDQNGRRRSFKSSSYSEEEIYNDSASRKSYGSREDYMQSDDPSFFYEAEALYGSEDDTEENEDDIFSLAKSIYIFPTPARVRHNKRSDFLSFRYENSDDMAIMRTILHLYIRGWDWIAIHDPDLLERLGMNCTDKAAASTEFVISIHRALKRPNSSNYTHTVQMVELRQNIPSGMGNWIHVDLKDLSDTWIDGGESHQMIVIKTPESWMRHFIVTGIEKKTEMKNEKKEKGLTAHMEIRTQRKGGRHRRSTSLDCQESDNEVRCCRYPLKVNFTSFGWSFVVAPTDFDAYFCNGECKLGYLEQYTHTHIASLSRSASPCCSPTKMSSLTLLYFNLEQNLVLSTIPNMTVEKCSCS